IDRRRGRRRAGHRSCRSRRHRFSLLYNEPRRSRLRHLSSARAAARTTAPSPQRGEGWGEGVRMKKANPKTARRLRRQQTDAERVMWFRLRDRRLEGWKFRRQFPIDHYIVDFFCADAHLIIELDGGQHATQTETDEARTKVLEAMGYLGLRFWNNDVLQNVDGVLGEIITVLGEFLPNPLTLTLSPTGRGN